MHHISFSWHSASSTGAAVPPGSRAAHRQTSRDDPQYFLLEHNRKNNTPQQRSSSSQPHERESKSDDPAFHRMQAVRLAMQKQPAAAANKPQKSVSAFNNNSSVSGSGAKKPEVAPKPTVKPDAHRTSVTSTRSAPTSAGVAVTSPVTSSAVPEAGKPPVSTSGGNDVADFNGSCHEIPLRPSRFTAHNVNNTRTENTTGKTSWP